MAATYSLVPPAHKNAFHSPTETAVIDKVDFERERDEYMEWIRRSVNRLSPRERELIVKRYLSDEEMYDYELYNEMGMSGRQYYRTKARTLYKLAVILRIEVYKKKA